MDTTQPTATGVHGSSTPVDRKQHAQSSKLSPEATYTYIAPRKIIKSVPFRHDSDVDLDEDSPLVDTTVILPKRSRKTERLQRHKERKLKKITLRSETKSFLELPPELLEEVLSWLQPRDVLKLSRLTKATRDFIQDHEASIARSVIQRRYHNLAKSFYLPVHIAQVEPHAQASLLSARWQQMVAIHKRSYQHIQTCDPLVVCSCTACVLAWNNLCLVLDLAHFQKHLQERDIIPRILPGERPEWNRLLTESNARLVERAMAAPLVYAGILQKHLTTIVATLTREARVGRRVWKPKRLFDLSDADIASGTDGFLERKGPTSYEFPYQRDKYLDLQAYVPNRIWIEQEQEWRYPLSRLHDSDVAMVVARFKPDPPIEDDSLASTLYQQLKV